MNKLLNNKVFQIVSNVLSTIILIISIIICILVVASTKASTGMPNLFGNSILSVKSDSMEPTFNKGDLIFVKVTPKSEKEQYKHHIYEVGDIITFEVTDEDGHNFVNTHRIVSIEDGERTRYKTKGDNVDAIDKKSVYNMNILGQYTGKKLSGWGKVFDYLKKPEGVLVSVVLPAMLIILWQIFVTVFGYLKKKDELLLQLEQAGGYIPEKKKSNSKPESTAAQQQSAYGLSPEQFAALQAQILQAQLTMQQNQYSQKPMSLEERREKIIRDYEELQKSDEARKQEIIAEYLAEQASKAAEEEKEKAEEDKIKAIIESYLSEKESDENKQ